MDNSFYIKYSSKDPNNSSRVELGELLESLAGFDKVIGELFHVSKIQGDLIVSTEKVETGSILLRLALDIQLTGLPFIDTRHAIDFLQVANRDLALAASAAADLDGNLNTFWRDRPFDASVISGLTGFFLAKMMGYTKQLKHGYKAIDGAGEEMPVGYVEPLKRMINRGAYKKALKPFVDDKVQVIEVGVGKNNDVVKIDETSFQEYLGEAEKILPEYQLGQEVTLNAVVTGMQSTRGDTLTLKLLDHGGLYVTGLPDENHTSADYRELYQQTVKFTGKVYRKNVYQKPKFIIDEIEPLQDELFSAKEVDL